MMSKQQHRAVRSYVKREGRITQGQLKALGQLWPKCGINPHGVLDFNKVFGREADTTLEIGFGNGESLLQMAQAQTDMNFLGIEVYSPGVGRLLASIHAQRLTNVRVIMQDAVEVFRENIPDNSLCRVMIFFPDPWPKKRHHKRRLIQPEFVSLVVSKLKPKGVIHCATDWENYAEQMLDVLSSEANLENSSDKDGYAKRPDYRPLTKFERRGKSLGHSVWDLILLKKRDKK